LEESVDLEGVVVVWAGEGRGRLQRVNLSEFNYSTGSSLIII
jgi:hypothetical protein